MADFYAARDSTVPPLPWPSIAPPFSCCLARGRRRVRNMMKTYVKPVTAKKANLAEVAALPKCSNCPPLIQGLSFQSYSSSNG